MKKILPGLFLVAGFSVDSVSVQMIGTANKAISKHNLRR
jgi:hypothetical protein